MAMSKEEKARRKAEILKHKPPIAKWKPKPADILVESDGKVLVFKFHKIFHEDTNVYERFMIDKTSYEKQLDQIAYHMNYFMNHYDDENEFALHYLRIKYVMTMFDTYNIPPNTEDGKRDIIIDNFIDWLYEEMFFDESSHMIAMIDQFVSDNYLDDVENNNGRKKVNTKEYLESLEFTNAHMKIMLKISFGMKIISPIMFHYLFINKVKLQKDSDIIYRFYKKLFEIFSHDDNGNKVNMFNKIFVYVKSRVLESNSINQMMYEKRSIFGMDVFVVINNFVKKVLISENMVKYSFPEKWDPDRQKYEENINGLTNVVESIQNLSNCGKFLLKVLTTKLRWRHA